MQAVWRLHRTAPRLRPGRTDLRHRPVGILVGRADPDLAASARSLVAGPRPCARWLPAGGAFCRCPCPGHLAGARCLVVPLPNTLLGAGARSPASVGPLAGGPSVARPACVVPASSGRARHPSSRQRPSFPRLRVVLLWRLRGRVFLPRVRPPFYASRYAGRFLPCAGERFASKVSALPNQSLQRTAVLVARFWAARSRRH